MSIPKHAIEALPAIYDAATSEENWPVALDAVASASGARGTILLAYDIVGLPFQVQKWCTTYRDEDIQTYFERFGKYEERAVALLRADPDKRLFLDTDAWPDAEATYDREDYVFLRERYGVEHRAVARLNENCGWHDMLAVQVNKGWSEILPAMQEELGFLTPHLAKVVEINRTFTLLRARYQAVLTALDNIGIGICVTLADGQVLVSNEEADRIFAEDDGLCIGPDRHIITGNEDITRQLGQAIEMTAATAAGEDNCAEFNFPVQRRSGGLPYLIEVCPLRDSMDELEARLRGSLVCIIDPSAAPKISSEGLSVLFAFSAVEKAVCEELLMGRSTQEIAELRNVSVETIRTQIKSIYQKSGSASRIELIRSALSANPPIR